MIPFTWQDFYTFAIGAVVAVLFELGSALVQSQQAFDDFSKWSISLAVALLTALGRYLLTYLTQRGLTKHG